MAKKSKAVKKRLSLEEAISDFVIDCLKDSHPRMTMQDDNYWGTYFKYKLRVQFLISKAFNIDYYTVINNMEAVIPKKVMEIEDFLTTITPEDIYYLKERNFKELIESFEIVKEEYHTLKTKREVSIIALDLNTNHFAQINDGEVSLVEAHEQTEFGVLGNDIEKSIAFYQEKLEQDFPEQYWKVFTRSKTKTKHITGYPFF